MKVLIIDDELRIVRGVKKYFEQSGFQVLEAFDGLSGLNLARTEEPDLVVLDLMLPEMDGLDVCRALRKTSDVPIIMLTARVDESEKLIGLELGADDYVTKPFSPRELVARARAVLRRVQPHQPKVGQVFEFDNINLDVGAHELKVSGKIKALTPTEFSILHYMLNNPNQVLSRSQLLEAADLGVFDGLERTIDVHVHNLRKKVEDNPSKPKYIKTVFGIGYRFYQENR